MGASAGTPPGVERKKPSARFVVKRADVADHNYFLTVILISLLVLKWLGLSLLVMEIVAVP